MKKKVVLITGPLGQDGRIITDIFYKSKKFKVIGLDNKNKLNNKKINIFKINLLNKIALKKFILKHKPNYLLHFAAKNYSNNSKKKNNLRYKRDYLYNYRISKNIIDSIVSLKLKTSFFFPGSSQMYEGYSNKIINEKTSFRPINYYSQYKVDIHNYFIFLKKKKKINGSTLIFFNHDSIYRNNKFLLPRLIKYFMSNKITLINNIYKSNIIADYSHAKDICQAVYLLILKKKYPDIIVLSSFKKFFINDAILYYNKYFNLKLKTNIKLKNKVLLGDNTFEKNILKFKPEMNIYYAINQLLYKSLKL
jgi:GDP-D-mannose dehydratase